MCQVSQDTTVAESAEREEREANAKDHPHVPVQGCKLGPSLLIYFICFDRRYITQTANTIASEKQVNSKPLAASTPCEERESLVARTSITHVRHT